MKSRDRIILMALLVAGLLGGFWFAVLAPERQEAKDLSAKVTAAQARLAKAQATARAAQQAKARYGQDYATIVELGKAVPAADRVPSLLYQLHSAARGARIRFDSFQSSGGADPSSATSATTAAQVAALGQAQNGTSGSTPASPAPAGTTVGAAGFPSMPFTFQFNGTYRDLHRLTAAIDRFVAVRGPRIDVRGRLLQVDGISLAPEEGGQRLSATVNATAYVLPADEGATNGATPSAPAGASAITTATASGGTR